LRAFGGDELFEPDPVASRKSAPRGTDRAAASIFATIIFIAATFVAFVSSQTYAVQLILCSAFATPVIDTIVAARYRG